MILISFKDGQGLGNQLWLFASAKSICEKLGIELVVKDFDKFKGKDFLILDYESTEKNTAYFEDNYSLDKFEIFNERVYYDNQLKYTVSSFDERVLLINKDTILEGIFQSEKYFFDNLEKLKKYIKPKELKPLSNDINSNLCILNIRGGEYKRHKKFILPKQYWEDAMENFKKIFNISEFKIVTDDYKYAKSLFPGFDIIHNDIAKCYLTIFYCKNIIVSNSSFSYFPCKTGLKKNVIAPMHWARHHENLGRWISPGNVYKDWLWQDKKGIIHDYEECYEIAKKTDKFYREEFTVLINKKDVPKTGIFNFIPKNLKNLLKKFLSYIFPLHFG